MLTCQKHLFSLEDHVHYLNCAYMSPLMKSVVEAGHIGIEGKARPYRISPADFFTDSHLLRREFASLTDFDQPERMAIVPSASYGMAVVAKNLKATAGDNIVVVSEQFPSNVYSWHKMEATHGVKVKTIAPPENSPFRGKEWNEQILNAIDERTCLVALPHVHWSDGTLFDLKAIREKSRQAGAWMVIDGTQSVGALPFSVKEIQPDALICAGYKWLFGPYSIGMAYFGEVFDEGSPLEENWINRKDSENFSGLVNYNPEYQPGALRYEVGEHSNFILVPMMLEAVKQLNAWKVEEVQAYARNLVAPWLDKFREKGFAVESPEYRGSHLIGLRHPGIDSGKIQKQLAEKHVHVSLRGNSIRVAISVFNNEDDLAALYSALIR